MILGGCAFPASALTQVSRPVTGGIQRYTGRVLNAADGKPLAGTTVVLIPNSAVDTHTEHAVQITEANGAYEFQHVPRLSAFVVAVRPGLEGGRSNSSRDTQAPAVALEDIALGAVASPAQMDGAVIAKAYVTSSMWVHFRDASFSADGATLSFSSDDGGRGGGLKGWSYDLKSHTLRAGAVQPFQVDLEEVGIYHIDEFVPCHGCAATVTARPSADATHAKPLVVTSNLQSGIVASSDRTALVWGVSNEYVPHSRGNYQHLIGIYILATHRRRLVALPVAGEPLAARTDGGGFLVAYQSFGQCTVSPEDVARLAEDQEYREGPRGWSICILHVPSPGK